LQPPVKVHDRVSRLDAVRGVKNEPFHRQRVLTGIDLRSEEDRVSRMIAQAERADSVLGFAPMRILTTAVLAALLLPGSARLLAAPDPAPAPGQAAVATPAAGPAAPAATSPSSANPREAIAASHRKIDDDLKKSLMSPFTAVEAHYIDSG